MSDWKQVGENLVQHIGGTIYLRAKVKGKVIRVSLETDNLRLAKLKRDERLAGIRAAAVSNPTSTTVRTLGDAVAAISSRIQAQPDLKPETLKYYFQMAQILNKTLPVGVLCRTWTAKEAGSWWKKVAARYAPQRANNALGMCKQVGSLMVQLGLRLDDPTKKLKRMPIPETEPDLPSFEKLKEVVESIRGMNQRLSDESADYVAFLAFAGCRHGQARAFTWEHDEGEWLKFPSGVSGTKGAATRRLPVSPPLREVLDRIKSRTGQENPSGPIFSIHTPRKALTNACIRVGIPHLTPHLLRHWFTTFAIEKGVEIPTVAKWLGHKDGGRLLLKRYGHLRDEHSLASAKKLVA